MTNLFIEKMAVLYQQVPSALFTSIRLAQAILESSWGQSELAINALNFAGIKASKDWMGDTYAKCSNEEIDGKVIAKESYFRKYSSVDDFVKDHSNFITSTQWRKNHYSSVINAKDYKEQANTLTGLYATDSGYGHKLIQIIEKYNLTQYDNKKESKNMAKHLVICGHGQSHKGYDPGATNKDGSTEAGLVRELAKHMQKYSTDIEYIMDRNVYEYRDIAKYTGYQTITELHMNAFNTTAKGAEVIIYAKYNEDNIDKAILTVLTHYFVNRGFKKRDNLYNVNVAAKSGFNYRLVELCFIDNNDDLRIFRQHMDSIARGLVEAITGNKVSLLEQLNQSATSSVIERGGTKTPDVVLGTLTELFEGSIVEVRQQATHYYNGHPINPIVNGQKYTITGKMVIDNQYSKFAYRLAKNGSAIGWVYGHDIVESYQQETSKVPQKESKEITLNGKDYIITEK